MDQQIKPRAPAVGDTVRIKPHNPYLQEFDGQTGTVVSLAGMGVAYGYEVRMEFQKPQEDTWPFDVTELELVTVDRPEAIEVFL